MMEFCKYLKEQCPNQVCEDVLKDGTPIMTPRCNFPYWHTVYHDAPPEKTEYEKVCPYYTPQ